MKYRIYFINFQYYAHEEADNLEGAKEIARKSGFQSRIEEDGKPVMGYCTIGGFRKL